MKKKQVVLYIIVMLILLTTSVYATISSQLDVKVKTKNNIITPGDEIEITLYLKGLTTDKNIKYVEGYIDYNKDIIEPLTLSSVVTNEDGKVRLDDDNILTVSDGSETSTDVDKGIIFNCNPVRGDGDCRLVVNFDKPVNKEIDLVTLKFKIKENASAGEYKSAIKYKLFGAFADDASESLQLNEKTISIIINKASETDNGTNNNTVNETKNETKNETTKNEVKNETKNETKNESKDPSSKNEAKNESKNPSSKNESKNESKNPSSSDGQGSTQKPNSDGTTSKKDDKTVSPTNLPKTGYKIIVIPIAVIAIIGLVFYKKYSKYNKFDNQ